MTTTQIKKSLDAILTYMQPFWRFVNCHMVNYITDKHWEEYIPAEIRTEISDIQKAQSCINIVFWNQNEKELAVTNFTAVFDFISKSKQFYLKNLVDIITTLQDLYDIIEKVSDNKLNIKEFMSEKKRHEVELTAELVNDLLKFSNNNRTEEIYIVDAGDGKGYLSSRLALQYKQKVLGIDFNENNTENALERNKKLQRVWNGLTERAELENKGITPPRRGKKIKTPNVLTNNPNQGKQLENYQTISKFITTDLNITDLIRNFFPVPLQVTPNYCLTGLHTCGNLSPTCLKVFHAQPECRILCNIGCCYHLLKETYSGQEFFGNKLIMDMHTEAGFPMSAYLQNKQIKLGRNARMLAVQSIDRTLDAKELPNISLFYRAVLEVLICEQYPHLKGTIQVGKIKKYDNFEDYVKKCGKKLDFDIKTINSEKIDGIERKYVDHKHFLDLFYLLRMTLAPILETLILLDRLLYLRELGYEQSYLVPLFDPVISPRCFGIIALKD